MQTRIQLQHFPLSKSSHILQMSITAAPWRWVFIRLFQQHFVQQGKRGVSTMIKKPINAVTNRLFNLKSSLPCCSFVTESWTICPRKCSRTKKYCFSRFCCFRLTPFLCYKPSIMQTLQNISRKYKIKRVSGLSQNGVCVIPFNPDQHSQTHRASFQTLALEAQTQLVRYTVSLTHIRYLISEHATWLTCSIRSDGSQLHCQGITCLPVVLHGMSIAPAAIEEPLPTEHGAIGQVQPQVLPQVTLGALPPTGRQSREKSRNV